MIDISRIFKEHPRFIEEMARLKARVEAEDAKMKARADQLQSMADKLKTLKPGSQEYKDNEKSIASERAQMQIDIQVQRKEFLQQEAAIYKEIYEEREDRRLPTTLREPDSRRSSATRARRRKRIHSSRTASLLKSRRTWSGSLPDWTSPTIF